MTNRKEELNALVEKLDVLRREVYDAQQTQESLETTMIREARDFLAKAQTLLEIAARGK